MTHILFLVLKLCLSAFVFNVIQLKQVLTQEDNQLENYNLTECPRFHTQNLTGGKVLANGSYVHESKVYPPGHFGHFNYHLDEDGTEVNTTSHIRGCVCTHSQRSCARFCCEFLTDEDTGDMTLPEICPQDVSEKLYDAKGNGVAPHDNHNLIYHDLNCKVNEKTGELYEKFELNFSVYEVKKNVKTLHEIS